MKRRFPTKPKSTVVLACRRLHLPFGFSAFAQQAQLVIDATDSFGTYNDIEYVVYQGRLTGTAGDESFSAPFEIVAPADPSQGNGRLVFEPIHPISVSGDHITVVVYGPIMRDRFLSKAFLFGHGFSHAAICMHKDDRACEGFLGAPEMPAGALGFIVSFTQALKAGQAADMVGDIEYLYSVGFASSADPLDDLLLDPLGQGLFDLSLLVSNGWNSEVKSPPENPESPIEYLYSVGFASSADPLDDLLLDPLGQGLFDLSLLVSNGWNSEVKSPPENPESPMPASVGRVMVLLPEADVVRWGTLLRDDVTQPHYRSYEVAGGAQLASSRPNPMRGVTGVDWTPVLRALMLAGDRWVSEGIEPPPSTSLVEAVEGEVDPAYDIYDSGIALARDANLNAVGGVRVPYLELGQGQFIAVDYLNLNRRGLRGTFLDLACEPLADIRCQFIDYDSYMEQFVAETERLMGEGFLLRDDADVMIEWAAGNEVGMPGSCP